MMGGTALDLTAKGHSTAPFCTTPQNASLALTELTTRELRSEQGKFLIVLDTREPVNFHLL